MLSIAISHVIYTASKGKGTTAPIQQDTAALGKWQFL